MLWIIIFLIHYIVGVGFVLFWQRKNKYSLEYCSILMIALMSFFGPFFYFMGKKFDKKRLKEMHLMKMERDLKDQIEKMENRNISLYCLLKKVVKEPATLKINYKNGFVYSVELTPQKGPK